MPYIKPERRDQLKIMYINSVPHTAGELNFVVTNIVNNYLFHIKDEKGEYRYQDLNDVIGALEGAKLEFYRRVVVPYEEIKRTEHGDVY